jgi:hypothetical protein
LTKKTKRGIIYFMKEKEASQKWCPFARAVDYYNSSHTINKQDPVPVNRYPSGEKHPGAHCLAIECACWVDMGRDFGRCGLVNI